MAITTRMARAVIAGLSLVLSAAALATPPVTEELLHKFEYLGGFSPRSALIQASDGNYYGTTILGSVKDGGTVYRLTPDGVHTVIHEFDPSDGASGSQPHAGVMQASNGWLYGTTTGGGAFSQGVVFRLSLAGDYQALDDFSADKGYAGYGGNALIETPAGQIVGVASYGGRFGHGTLYALNANGLITTLHSFSPAEVGYPGSLSGGLIMARDGNLYGVSSRGGDNRWGSIYRVDAQANVTTAYSFSRQDPGNATFPRGPLANGPDGALYGVSLRGGTNDIGTIFRVSLSGEVAVLHSFKGYGNTGSYFPHTPILVDDQGNVFGVTQSGGASATCRHCGAVYRLSHGGSYQLLHSFAGPPDDGHYPIAGLLLALDGSLVGVTGDLGTVYRLSRTPPKAR
jgi:uncharacterized repeat protein (TIGR03803 family)